MNLFAVRESVATVNARLLNGEKPHDLPCPKCQQERGIALEAIGAVTQAACNICAFHWVVQ